MKQYSREFLVSLSLISFLMLTMVGCGSTSAPEPAPAPGGASPGEYLWEFSIIDSDIFISTINKTNGQLSPPAKSGGMACNNAGNISSIALTPSKKFLYAMDLCFNHILLYAVKGPGVELTQVSAVAVNSSLNSISIDAVGKYLYAVESPGIVAQYAIDATTGGLTATSSLTETGVDFRTAVSDPTGKLIFVNDFTGGRIFAYNVGANGSLSPVSGSPFVVANGGLPARLFIVSNGKFLYAPLSTSDIAAFTISPTGTVANVSGSPFHTNGLPSDLATDPSNKFLYLNTSSIQGFTIDPNTGALAEIPGSPFFPSLGITSIAVDPSGNFLYASLFSQTAANGSIAGFSIDPVTGIPAALSGSPFPAVPIPQKIISLRIP